MGGISWLAMRCALLLLLPLAVLAAANQPGCLSALSDCVARHGADDDACKAIERFCPSAPPGDLGEDVTGARSGDEALLELEASDALPGLVRSQPSMRPMPTKGIRLSPNPALKSFKRSMKKTMKKVFAALKFPKSPTGAEWLGSFNATHAHEKLLATDSRTPECPNCTEAYKNLTKNRCLTQLKTQKDQDGCTSCTPSSVLQLHSSNPKAGRCLAYSERLSQNCFSHSAKSTQNLLLGRSARQKMRAMYAQAKARWGNHSHVIALEKLDLNKDLLTKNILCGKHMLHKIIVIPSWYAANATTLKAMTRFAGSSTTQLVAECTVWKQVVCQDKSAGPMKTAGESRCETRKMVGLRKLCKAKALHRQWAGQAAAIIPLQKTCRRAGWIARRFGGAFAASVCKPVALLA